MASLSLLFEMTQNSNMTFFSNFYQTSGLVADTSMSTRAPSVSPPMPRDNSLLSQENLAYGHNGALCAPGKPITSDAGAYSRLLHQYQQIERELTTEKEEHLAIK